MRRLSVVLAILALGSPAWAQAKSKPAVPAQIMKQVLVDIRDEYHPHRRAPAAMFRALDINHDGKSDWIVDFTHSGENGWCGTGGCRQVIYVSEPKGHYRPVFDEQTRAFKVRMPGGVVRLDTDVHGSECGTFGASECPHSYAWDQAASRFVEAVTPGGVSRVRGPVLTNVETAKAPPGAVESLKREKRDCIAAGGKPDDIDNPPASVPDLNGDGVRDWVAQAVWCAVDEAKTAPSMNTEVWLSRGAGFTLGLAFDTEGYETDFATRPAHLVQVLGGGDCRFSDNCGERVWAWDPHAGPDGKGALKVASEKLPKPKPPETP
jgi:hypothetical protein